MNHLGFIFSEMQAKEEHDLFLLAKTELGVSHAVGLTANCLASEEKDRLIVLVENSSYKDNLLPEDQKYDQTFSNFLINKDKELVTAQSAALLGWCHRLTRKGDCVGSWGRKSLMWQQCLLK